MLIIPLSAVPSQICRVGLPTQQATIAVYQKHSGLFLDLSVNDAPILTGVICLDRVYIVRDVYLGFDGDLVFVDTGGIANPALREDPDYTGLGGRFMLAWVSQGDIATEAAFQAAAIAVAL